MRGLVMAIPPRSGSPMMPQKCRKMYGGQSVAKRRVPTLCTRRGHGTQERAFAHPTARLLSPRQKGAAAGVRTDDLIDPRPIERLEPLAGEQRAHLPLREAAAV